MINGDKHNQIIDSYQAGSGTGTELYDNQIIDSYQAGSGTGTELYDDQIIDSYQAGSRLEQQLSYCHFQGSGFSRLCY